MGMKKRPPALPRPAGCYTFEDFDEDCYDFSHYPAKGRHDALAVTYCALAAAGEAGEISDAIKKALRDDKFGERAMTPERRETVLLEIGDTLFYLTRLARELNSSITEVAEMNRDKLDRRYLDRSLDGDAIATEVVDARHRRLGARRMRK